MAKDKNTRLDRIDKMLGEFFQGMQELRGSIREESESITELKKSMKEERENIREERESIKELRESQRETNKGLKETEKLIKELSKNLGGMGNSIGKIPEYMSLPNIEQDFYRFKIDIKEIHPNIVIKYNGKAKSKEIDLILIGKFNRSKVVVVVETKLRYKSQREIDKFNVFIEREFKKILDEYKNYKVIGCVCALGYGHGLEKYAEKLGLFIMKPIKEIVGIINKPDFKFKIV